MKTARNASACVGKQPIMVATASTEHSYWLALAQAFLAVFVYATHATQAIAFEWKPGISLHFKLHICLFYSQWCRKRHANLKFGMAAP